MSRFARHWNSNQLCSISIRTNGTNNLSHEIVDICVLILDSELKPYKEFKPFWSEMSPRKPKGYDPETMQISKNDYCRILNNTLDADMMADLFEEWFEKLRLAWRKKLMVLCYDWVFMRPFMERWLGPEHMKYFFHEDVRDLKSFSLLENDKADFHVKRYPFPGTDLAMLARAMGVERRAPHNVLQDAMTIPEIYRRTLVAGASAIRIHDADLVGGQEQVSDLRLEGSLDPRS